MYAQAGVGILTSPRLSDWVRLDSVGITGLYVKTQGIGSLFVPIQVYAAKATSEYQDFVNEVNNAFLRVSPTESTVLMADFNAHVGTDTDTWKGVIGSMESLD